MSSRKLSSFAIPALFLAISYSALPVRAQQGEGPLRNEQPKGITTDQIIQKFAEKEKEFADARNNYSYRQMVKIHATGENGQEGEFEEILDVLFDDTGKRVINVAYSPPSTIENAGLQMTEEDYKDIEGLQPFVLTSDELPDYTITYIGQQQEDELNTYVFDIAPKQIDKTKRRFRGRVWVDDHDLQIVKVYGKGISQANFGKNPQQFPDFTTYREQIDGKYWFPTYTYADTTLHFPGGKNSPMEDVKFHEVVRYTNYKRFEAQHKIIYDGQVLPSQPQGQPPQQQGTAQKPPR
jgi:hypothetical protein